VTELQDLDRLRAAFAHPDDAPHPDRCPAPAEIWEGVHGQLLPDRLRDVVEHLATCSPCAEAWRLALLMERPAASEQVDEQAARQAAERTAAEGAAADRWARRPRWRLYAGLAAAAAAAVAVVFGVHDFRGGQPPPVVAQRGGTVEPATATRWLTPGEAVLPRDGVRLRWSGVPGATYDLTVELEDESGAAKPIAIAAQHGLEVTEHTVPATDLARVPAGAALTATLTAHLPDGRSETIVRNIRLR
jgi:hypothetical protein